jgi:hypothetical protein
VLSRIGLGVTLTLLAFAVPFGSAAQGQSGCSLGQAQTTGCPSVSGGINGDQVSLEGSGSQPGSGGGQSNGDSSSDINSNSDGGNNGSSGPDNGGWSRDPFLITAPLTLADIAHFRPNPGVDHMEPNGWMVVGLDTNFFSTGGVQVHDGELLGRPASVHFTPVAWHWTYGDGHSVSRGAPGSAWAAQGIREFDPTTTSHVYRRAGTYYIDLTIDFRAEYRYADGPWIPIAGVLPVPANRLVATAGSAKTVLVERECTVNPDGPGC